MAEVVRCDRCGDVFERPSRSWGSTDMIQLNGINCYKKYKDETSKMFMNNFDICPQCAKEFMKWLYKKDDRDIDKINSNESETAYAGVASLRHATDIWRSFFE